MNRELKRVSIIALLMFVTLLVSSTIIQYVQASALAADPRNARTLYESYSVERGPILVDGTPIAFSQPSDDDYKFQRVYANGPLYVPITGYIPVNGEATGLERSLNDYLSGQSSSQFFDSLNRLISGQDPMGASVEVAIDPVAQQAAWDALGDYTGAVIVTEPATGRILAMVTKPTFDPNALAVHNNAEVQATYEGLLADPQDPLFNRATGGDMNPPGSVFKLVVTAAALESGRYTPESTFPNPGELTLPGNHRGRAQLGRRLVRRRIDGDPRRRPAALVQHPLRRTRHGTRRQRHPRAGREVRLQQRVPHPHRDRGQHLPSRPRRTADRAERVRPGRGEGDPAADGDGVGGDRERRNRDEPQHGRPDHRRPTSVRCRSSSPPNSGARSASRPRSTMVQMMVNGVEDGAASMQE